ncbi:hypothetical protein CEXT_764401 [Caerostris extrusa]|uniref:Uncharacterized protein n=1 Tax=Caerostris extrusa TaxID=172846 RepID=A0AAV4MK85_CAEEX|nr:hypothetical protein CEXT_764401 [Caerostris extrusa]
MSNGMGLDALIKSKGGITLVVLACSNLPMCGRTGTMSGQFFFGGTLIKLARPQKWLRANCTLFLECGRRLKAIWITPLV